MRAIFFAAVAFSAIALTSTPARPAVVLNEVLVNPPGADDSREYVEILAAPGDSLAGVWLIEIEGDANAPGVVDHALDLSTASVGANGLLLIGHNYATSVPWPAVPSQTARASLRRPSNVIENGSVTFLLVRGFSAATGTDLDTNNDGALDVAPWDAVLDGVSWIDGASGRAYSPAIVSIASGVLDAAARFPGNATPSSGLAWYGGDVLASGTTPDLSTAYDGTHASANFPLPPAYVAPGALTPGAPNVPALVVVAVCGDGIVQAGEACDDHNRNDGDCCSASCAIEPASVVCRSAAGVCDRPETCDGITPVCPMNALLATGTECRASAGTCDVAETCDGMTAACPADGLLVAGTECRASAGTCDLAETCDGATATCPADAMLAPGTECRAAAGACDVAETCNGATATCPADALLAPGTECRASVGACDLAEACDGATAACPVDALFASGMECRAAAGACDVAERCDGTAAACPADGMLAPGTECRAAAGACDVAEACDGTTAACPADEMLAPGTECRATKGACDVAETCDGTTTACPADAMLASGTECRASASACDVAETCDGVVPACPADAALPDGVACDDADACTADDRCMDGACVGERDTRCDLPAFVCHKAAPAKAPRGAPPYPAFVSRSGDLVADALGGPAPDSFRLLDLLRPVASCGVAAAEDGPYAALAAYAAKLSKTAPRQAKPAKRVHTLESALGRLRVRIDGLSHFVASSSVARGTGGAPPLGGPGPDAFQCYLASLAREPGNAFEPVTVELADPLAGTRSFDLLGVSQLCAPASLNGAAPEAPLHAGHLICFKARLAKLDPPQAKDRKVRLSVTTAFGAEVVDAGALGAVCLPSLRLD